MRHEKYSLFLVTFKYRLEKNYELEPWKEKYAWKPNAYYVRCHHRYEIDRIVMEKVTENRKGEYQVKISEVSEVCIK